MSAAAFHVSVVRFEPELISVVCRGELDIATMGSFEEVIEPAFNHHPDFLLIDASKVSFMSIDALGYLIGLTARCRRESVGLGLDLSAAAWRLIGHLRPDEALQVRASRALGSPGAADPRACENSLRAAGGSTGPPFLRGRASSPSPG